MATFAIQTIGDKIVETLYSNRVTLENKRIHTPSLSPLFKVGAFAVFYSSSNSGITLHEGMGGEKLHFPLLKSRKHKKSQIRTKCLNSFYRL